MAAITSKAQLSPLIQQCTDAFAQKGEDAFVKKVNSTLLKEKVRFPLLEHAAGIFSRHLPVKHHYSVAKKIMQLNTEGGNVVVGVLLRNLLEKDLNKAIATANTHIVYGDFWYLCDIIGERVHGFALLTQPEKTIPVLKKMSRNENKWLVRTVGVAVHYAVKKGLKKKYVTGVLELLFTLAHTSDFHTRKGIGWAVKTIAKFHPDLIHQYEKELIQPGIHTWFKNKIRIGLGRSEKYASRYKG